MKNILTILLVLTFCLAWPGPARADTLVLLGSSVPCAQNIQDAALAALQADPPDGTTIYYAITYVEELDTDLYFVSMVGTTATVLADVDLFENITWAGSLTLEYVNSAWQADFLPDPAPEMSASAEGGGADIAFPFAQGSTALYGPLGVHGAGQYGTSGMYAVDFVGGSTYGANSMPDTVYASAAGEIDYICKDANNLAVRTTNQQTGDVFLYVHVLDNSSLVYGTNFSKGSVIGKLKHGSFENILCGGASQQDSSYHVHWMFAPKNGNFQVESWILNISSQKFESSTKTVSKGQFITASGVRLPPGDDDDTPITQIPAMNFWDFLVKGLVSIATGIAALLPAHTASAVYTALLTGTSVALRVFFVLATTVLNLKVAILVAEIILGLEGFRLLITALRFVKKYIPLL